MNETEEKLNRLKTSLRELGSVIVAFSGGVDSSFLLKVAHDTLSGNSGRALAVTARSSTYPLRELNEAAEIATAIGAAHRIIDSEELDIDGYADNPPDRCYFCKGELFGRLATIAQEEGYAAVLDGANADDAADYRPGARAAQELSVRSPLKEAGLTKEEIRALSKRFGLPTWDKPAFACLASRFPYGETITSEKLAMVEKAEQALRDLGFAQLRVRHHGDVARIELDPADIPRAVEKETAEKIHNAVKTAGFLYVAIDLLGYRTGSMNEALFKRGGAGG